MLHSKDLAKTIRQLLIGEKKTLQVLQVHPYIPFEINHTFVFCHILFFFEEAAPYDIFAARGWPL